MHWIVGFVATCLLLAGARSPDDRNRERGEPQIVAVKGLAKIGLRRGDSTRTVAKLDLEPFAIPTATSVDHDVRVALVDTRAPTAAPEREHARSHDARGPPRS